MHLHVENTTVVNVQAYDEHYLLKNNTSSSVVNQQGVNQQRAYSAVSRELIPLQKASNQELHINDTN
jgi:hypothetical protein